MERRSLVLVRSADLRGNKGNVHSEDFQRDLIRDVVNDITLSVFVFIRLISSFRVSYPLNLTSVAPVRLNAQGH